MRIRKRLKVVLLALIIGVSSSWADAPQGEPLIGTWKRLSDAPDTVWVPVFSWSRLAVSEVSGEPVAFTARISGLRSGAAYTVVSPYAAAASLASSGSASVNIAGGVSVVFVAADSETEVTVSAREGQGAPEAALRGVRVDTLAASSARSAISWLLLALISLFCLARAIIGVRQSVHDRGRSDEAFFALASCGVLLVAFSALRVVSLAVFSAYSPVLEERLRSIGALAFLVAASGAVAAGKPFRAALPVFLVTAVFGALAVAAAVLPFLPPALPVFVFSALMVAVFASSASAALVARRGYSAALAASAFIAAASFAVSCLLVSPLVEYFLLFASVVPFFAISLRSDIPPIDKEEAEPILSDYVDEVAVALTRFVPKEFLAILNKQSASELRLGDHVKKDMTIFFSDIRSFTSLSEGLTPEENFKFINSYLARVVPVVNAHGGFVDKYIGDAIMALFPEHTGADSAVRAAIEMQKRIVEYNTHRANCGYRALSMGIGLHTGTLMLGVVGVEDRMQSTVISDAVNLASRLESITKVFNVSLAISEETFKSLEDPGAYKYRFIGKVRVKGKSDPVSVFEIFDGIDPEYFERKMQANRFFEQGMLSYYQKDFRGAMFYFRKVLEVLPEDGAATFYLDNCLSKAQI